MGYKRTLRDLSQWISNKRSVSRGYFKITKYMYERSVMNVRITYGGTCEFLVTITSHIEEGGIDVKLNEKV